MVEDLLTITDKAWNKISELLKKKKDDKKQFLRVYIEGGGCAGYQYRLELEDFKREDDNVIQKDDIEVIIDSISAMYLQGAKLDYIESVYGEGFKFENPNSSGSCGCGHSFSA